MINITNNFVIFNLQHVCLRYVYINKKIIKNHKTKIFQYLLETPISFYVTIFIQSFVMVKFGILTQYEITTKLK